MGGHQRAAVKRQDAPVMHDLPVSLEVTQFLCEIKKITLGNLPGHSERCNEKDENHAQGDELGRSEHAYRG